MVNKKHGDSFEVRVCCECVCKSLTVTAGGRVRGCTGLVGIVVHYTLLYISGGIWGPLFNCWFNGPTTAM